jgi:hypothetical protein
MPIASVIEIFDGRGGTVNGMFERTWSRVFEVDTTGPNVGPVAVWKAVDPFTGLAIPLIGAFYTNGVLDTDPDYEFDHGSFANEIRIDQASEVQTSWRVTVGYGPFNSSVFGADPTEWKMRVQFGGERTERVVDFATDGTPIKNSAGDRFGDPVTVDDHITTMTITRNELVSTYDPGLASTYSDTINNATWNGFAINRCKMGIITTSEPRWAPDSQVWYYEVTYPIQISRTAWVKILLDQGYNALVGSVARPIMRDGQPISEPVALDGSGGELPVTGTPVTITAHVFDEADWSGLAIDLSLRLGA